MRLKLKLLLLCSYFIFLFAVCRILESTSRYYDNGITFSVLDPITLKVKQLKKLLDLRGIDYSGLAEKHEFAELLLSSGKVSNEELNEAFHLSQVPDKTIEFTDGSNFYEEVGGPKDGEYKYWWVVEDPVQGWYKTGGYDEVEDTKNKIWLIQIIVNDNDHSMLTKKTWNEIKDKVGSSAGIKSGIFRCSSDRRFCNQKGWSTPRLILALPRGSKVKEDVVMHYHSLPSTSESILHWVRKHLTSQVAKINSEEELEQWMIYSDNSIQYETRVILFSSLKSCPLFLSALAFKFSDQVKFATVDVIAKKWHKKYLISEDGPSYMIITPEKIYFYGVRRGEFYNFKSMELYLKTCVPDMNDVFLFSLLLINVLAAFELLNINSCLWKYFLGFVVCVVKYNIILLLFWILISSSDQFPTLMTFLTKIVLKIFRIVGGSDIARVVRNDYKNLYSSYFIFLTFGLFASGSLYILKKFKWLQPFEAEPLNVTDSLEREAESSRLARLYLEMAIRQLNERSQPAIPMDYIANLPKWNYRGWCEADDGEEELERNLNFEDIRAPEGMLETRECSICLENYQYRESICGLHCGHNFHTKCIIPWLFIPNHCCPKCRKPSYNLENQIPNLNM